MANYECTVRTNYFHVKNEEEVLYLDSAEDPVAFLKRSL